MAETRSNRKLKCPIEDCGKIMRKPFHHFMHQHPKADLALLICKLLGIEAF